MTTRMLFDQLLELQYRLPRDLSDSRIDICINRRNYIPITGVHEFHERIKLVSSTKYKSLNYIEVMTKLQKLLVRTSNGNRDIFMTWLVGTEYVPIGLFMNKKGIVINMK